MADHATYRARNGSHLTHADAQRIGTVLADKFGKQKIHPRDFVRTARPKNSPLHDDLEWDDTAAGEQWRLEQARKIMGALVRVEVLEDGQERERRAYLNVVVTTNGIRERAYLDEQRVWADTHLRSQVLREAAREADRAAKRLDEYEELAGEAASLREIAAAVRDRIAA